MRWLWLVLLLGCGEIAEPALRDNASFIIDCMEQPEHPDCQLPPPVTLYLWARNFLPDSLVVYASAPGATQLYSSLAVALDPGTLTIRQSVDGDVLMVTHQFSFVSSRIVWSVMAVQGNLVVATDSLVWVQ